MPVIINFKICDNAEACNAINVCPTGAFHWNSEKKTLEIDKDKCIECGACATSEKSCQVGAIRFARTKEALEQIKKEIAEDPRTISDLQADRYGATPINMPFSCSENELDSVLTTTKTCLIEVYNEDSIECLIKSIPVKEILKEIDNSTYRKVEVKSEDFKKKYSINELPSLLIFKDKNLLGKIEGYYSVDEKDSLIEKINKILE
jgi:NAD-dependent dihydropyrimidine dehydrogenase PreA subunit